MTETLLPPPPHSRPIQADTNCATPNLHAGEPPGPSAPPAGESGTPPSAAAVQRGGGEGRLPNGRFAVGNAGKPRGARSRIAADIDRALEAGVPEALRTICGAAACGNLQAAMWLVSHFSLARKGRAVEIEGLPELRGPADVPLAISAIAAAVGNGDLSVDEAASAANVLRTFLVVLESA